MAAAPGSGVLHKLQPGSATRGWQPRWLQVLWRTLRDDCFEFGRMRSPPDSSTDTFARSESASGPRGNERLLVVERAAGAWRATSISALRSAEINPSASVCPGAAPERNIWKGRKCQDSSTDYAHRWRSSRPGDSA